MAENLTNKEHLNWEGLARYTKDFKEWLFPLLQRIHARIGHVEEKLYNVEQKNKATYSIKLSSSEGKIKYTLIDDSTKEVRGDVINIDTSTGIIVSTWSEDLN